MGTHKQKKIKRSKNFMSEIKLEGVEKELPITPNQFNELCNYCLTVKCQTRCPHFLTCPFQKNNKANVVINEYKYTKEILIFKDAFYQRASVDVDNNIDRTRNWVYNDLGLLVPTDKNKEASIFKLLNVLKDSRKRTMQNFYGYARSNDWSYFLTLTFKNKDRLTESQVEYIWKLFRQRLQYYFPNIQILCVRETHVKGGLHIHGLIGNVNLDKHLIRGVNSQEYYIRKKKKVPNKYYMQPIINEFGDPVYNIDPKIYNEGHLTIVKVKDPNSDRLSNYMSKYFLKGNMKVGFQKKVYWHTHNLAFYNKYCSYLTNEEKQALINEINLLNFSHYKETEKAYIYTIKK